MPSKRRICFGERAFGHAVNLAFGSHLAGTPFGTVDLDHVAVVGATNSPAAGRS